MTGSTSDMGSRLKIEASHREPQRRVTQMNKFHDSPPRDA